MIDAVRTKLNDDPVYPVWWILLGLGYLAPSNACSLCFVGVAMFLGVRRYLEAGSG